MEEILNGATLALGLLPIIIGINALLKKIGLDGRFSPIINLILGFIAFPVLIESFTLYQSIIASIVLGLAAGGFYDLGKRTILDK